MRYVTSTFCLPLPSTSQTSVGLAIKLSGIEGKAMRPGKS